MKTLVIGSTGVLGSWVVAGLTAKGETVRCMSRSWDKIRDLPEDMERICADLNKPHTLADACSGVDNMLLLVPMGENETVQGINAVRAAKDSGVKKVVYLSTFMPAGAESIPYFGNKMPVEEALKDSGMNYTILRPNNYFQNDVSVIGVVTGFGIYPTPIGMIGLNRVDVRDVAECAVNALTRDECTGETVSLHGRESLTGRDIAAIYSRHVGRDVRYAGDDLDYWQRHVENILPRRLYLYLRAMYGFVQDHGMIARREELELQKRLLWRPPTSFDTFGKELSREWNNVLASSCL